MNAMVKKRVVIVNQNVTSYKAHPYAEVVFTNSSSEAAKALFNLNPQIIELVGGDGTLSGTLNDVLFQDASFLSDKLIKITPKGSGNDRNKSLKELDRAGKSKAYSGEDFSSAGDAFRIITDDYLLATINDTYQRYIFDVGGIGLDSQTLLEYEDLRRRKMPATFRYFEAASKAIYKLNGSVGKVDYDIPGIGLNSAEPVMFLFMVGKYFGGGMPINHKLLDNDGLFESIILKRGTNLKLFRSLIAISLLQQPQYKNPLVSYLEPMGKVKLEVDNTDKFYFESDGEVLMENNKPVSVHKIEVEIAGKITYLLD